MKTISEHGCFGGMQGYYSHASKEIGLEMKFSVFRPPQAKSGKVPVLYYLAGLTCTEETFAIKAGAQRVAAELVPGESDSWDFGVGAGFYVDAMREPWSKHYRMYSYVTRELPALIGEKFPADPSRQGIFGHSMGGHGALVCALRNPGQYRSLSALAPVAAPMRCPWGKKAFKGYLGDDHVAWQEYDASELVKRARFAGPILVDQGLADKFLADQLYPEIFEAACREARQPLTLRRQEGYDHGYFFISTFMEDHLRHHAEQLKA
jgi:S-formylglutathione hydrolase